MELSIPVVVLFLVFGLIAVRQVGRFRLKIWQIMFGGALVVLLTLQISLPAALEAVDLDVMLFLLGMFIVGEALYRSGYLFFLGQRIFRHARSVDHMVLLLLFCVGLLSAFLMNDTLAIIGTPLVLHYASKQRVSPKLLLLALAFAVTTGSAMSPIGNPQNLLIALNGGITDPFVAFFSRLLLPTIINLLLAYVLLRLFYREEFHPRTLEFDGEVIKDVKLANLCKVSLVIVAILVAVKIALVAVRPDIDFRLTYIALAAAAPIVLGSSRRTEIVKGIDWPTLVFFASMFVLMASVWETGFFQELLGGAHSLTSLPMVLGVSVVLSQFISNVPFVALYMPLLAQAGGGPTEMVALAAGSTIAGNLLILGAASNVIIIQNAEKEGETLTFWEFARVGIPLTILNCLTFLLLLQF
ncbi:MAG: SLC13 family permease [Methanomassiliicoccus sp.]|nr:SLC13 family permease [Methanomassiliicoccus sp.]